jgi:hypothetical protein
MQCPSKQSSVRVVVRVRPGYHEPIAAQNTSDTQRGPEPCGAGAVSALSVARRGKTRRVYPRHGSGK